MAKIELDKYYTPDSLALYCIEKTKEVIGEKNITGYLEPSAGGGAFSRQIPDCEAYDIKPECDGVIQQDFLTLWRPHQDGLCIIGNPPFGGVGSVLLRKFFNQAKGIGDYIAWILPISQLNNTRSLSGFDLIYSEDLGSVEYSGRPVHCCFNIYSRPIGLLENKREVRPKMTELEIKSYSATDVDPCGEASDGLTIHDWDLAICRYGGSIGRVADHLASYKGIFAIRVNREDKEDILDLIYSTNWLERYPFSGVPSISQWMIEEVVKEQYPDLK